MTAQQHSDDLLNELCILPVVYTFPKCVPQTSLAKQEVKLSVRTNTVK